MFLCVSELHVAVFGFDYSTFFFVFMSEICGLRRKNVRYAVFLSSSGKFFSIVVGS